MVNHLPQAIKQLLTQRNPNPFSSPPLRKLTGVLQQTRNQAKTHGAENGWLTLSVCDLPSTNLHALTFA